MARSGKRVQACVVAIPAKVARRNPGFCHRQQHRLKRLGHHARTLRLDVAQPNGPDILRIHAILLLDDGGDHQLLALDSVLGGSGFAVPAVAVVLVRAELVVGAVLPLDTLVGPALHHGAHRGPDVACSDAPEELFLQ